MSLLPRHCTHRSPTCWLLWLPLSLIWTIYKPETTIHLRSLYTITLTIQGSIFELTGGGGSSTSTTLGFVPTATIAAMGLPLSIFLIYAAILKGAAETEEDDAQYNNQNNNRRRYWRVRVSKGVWIGLSVARWGMGLETNNWEESFVAEKGGGGHWGLLGGSRSPHHSMRFYVTWWREPPQYNVVFSRTRSIYYYLLSLLNQLTTPIWFGNRHRHYSKLESADGPMHEMGRPNRLFNQTYANHKNYWKELLFFVEHYNDSILSTPSSLFSSWLLFTFVVDPFQHVLLLTALPTQWRLIN